MHSCYQTKNFWLSEISIDSKFSINLTQNLKLSNQGVMSQTEDVLLRITYAVDQYACSLVNTQYFTKIWRKSVFLVSCKRIPQQRRSLCSSFVISFSLIFATEFYHVWRLVSRIQKHTDTKLCAYPVHSLALQCTSKKMLNL